MFDENQLWKIQVYTERAWRISADLAVEAGRLGRNGKGIAIVAEEARTIANVLFQAVDKMRSCPELAVDLSDVLWRMNQLVLNGAIETIRVGGNEEAAYTSKSVAVTMEEMRILNNDLIELLENRKVAYIPRLEVIKPNPVTNSMLFLFQFTIGGVHFVENIEYVIELIVYDKNNSIQNNAIMVRGKKIPIIDCYSQFGLTDHKQVDHSYGCAVIINADWFAPDQFYAVLVDDFATNGIFRSKMGMRVEPKDASLGKEYIRESWDAAENKQFIFPDWIKIAGRK